MDFNYSPQDETFRQEVRAWLEDNVKELPEWWRNPDVSGPEVDKLVSENPYYAHARIPAAIYPGMDTPVDTFGVLATLVSSADVDEDAVYAFVKRVFENFDKFKRMHLVFRDLQPETMISQGLSAPLHPGALRYYRERGWISR